MCCFSLKSELVAASNQHELTPAEEPAISTLSNLKSVDRVIIDVKIYVEACIACKYLPGTVVMLVTDDHAFFRVFAHSRVTEYLLV